MYKKVAFIWLLGISFNVFGWGAIGHRTVGKVAEQHLKRKVRKKIEKILDGESLAVASTWMDNIKSDDAFDSLYTWHYVTIPPGMTYEATDKAKDGDVIAAIEHITKTLKKGGLTHEVEAAYVKMLVHLVGDIHQPLHVGTGEDKGGNDLKVEWFYRNSNLHRVWDSGMIDSKQFSYTELAEVVSVKISKDSVKRWQSSDVRTWAKESIQLRDQVYDLPQDKQLSYRYMYKNWDILQLRLAQAGVRLAGLLNEIYG